jgi:hypothetical protein
VRPEASGLSHLQPRFAASLLADTVTERSPEAELKAVHL